jgi:hypothetical protein
MLRPKVVMKRSTKNHLLGCLDAMLFMPRTGERFSGSYNDMLGSFVIVVLISPLMLLSALIAPAPALAEQSQNLVSLTYALRFSIALGIFVGFVYLLAAHTQRRQHFYKFVTAYNWLMIPSILLSLPVTLMMASDNPATAYQGLVLSYFLLVYIFAFTSYIAACTLRIPIELAGFIAIISLQIDHTSYEFVNWVGAMLS